MLQDEPVDCIIVDAYSDVFDDTNMNSTAESRAFLHKFHVLSTTYKCVTIFLHHISKAKETSGPSKNNLIGSQALEAKARVVFELRRDLKSHINRHYAL
jgi:RecA-family ATPase